jgi:hypothetical protein
MVVMARVDKSMARNEFNRADLLVWVIIRWDIKSQIIQDEYRII